MVPSFISTAVAAPRDEPQGATFRITAPAGSPATSVKRCLSVVPSSTPSLPQLLAPTAHSVPSRVSAKQALRSPWPGQKSITSASGTSPVFLQRTGL